MAGAEFIRVDLHVHTFADAGQAQLAAVPSVAEYVRVAAERGIRVLGITDHNTAKNVAEAVDAAKDSPILLLPGIEVSTHEGHLLGLFAPSEISDLEAFAHPTNLQLIDVQGPDEKRSQRSMLDLVIEIASSGGLAVTRHRCHPTSSRLGSVSTGPGLVSPGSRNLPGPSPSAPVTVPTMENAATAGHKARSPSIVRRPVRRLMSFVTGPPPRIFMANLRVGPFLNGIEGQR